MSLITELESLFGQHIVDQAQNLEPEKVDALAVNAAAGALLRLKGNPDRLRKAARSLKPETAVALCRWMADPSFWGVVGGITRH